MQQDILIHFILQNFRQISSSRHFRHWRNYDSFSKLYNSFASLLGTPGSSPSSGTSTYFAAFFEIYKLHSRERAFRSFLKFRGSPMVLVGGMHQVWLLGAPPPSSASGVADGYPAMRRRHRERAELVPQALPSMLEERRPECMPDDMQGMPFVDGVRLPSRRHRSAGVLRRQFLHQFWGLPVRGMRVLAW